MSEDSPYIQIQRSIWYKAQFKTLSDDGKLLFLYVNSCHHGNMIGLYVLPIGYGCEDLGWDRERFTKGLHELLDKHLIKYDFDTNVVLDLHHIIKFPPQNPNQVKAAIKKFNDLPYSPLFQDFVDRLEQLPEPFIKPLCEHARKRYSESEPVPVPVTGTVTGLKNPMSEMPDPPPEPEPTITPTLAEAIPLAQLLHDQIQTVDPKFKATEKQLMSWAQEIERLIRIDARSPDEVRRVIEWINASPFWRGNILSGKKLREKFPQLFIKMQSPEQRRRAVGELDIDDYVASREGVVV